jgi:hypothetical protein
MLGTVPSRRPVSSSMRSARHSSSIAVLLDLLDYSAFDEVAFFECDHVVGVLLSGFGDLGCCCIVEFW